MYGSITMLKSKVDKRTSNKSTQIHIQLIYGSCMGSTNKLSFSAFLEYQMHDYYL